MILIGADPALYLTLIPLRDHILITPAGIANAL